MTLIQLTAQAGEGSMSSFLPILLMFAVMYFLMIRPQMKKSKEQKNFRNALKKGDKVMVSGSIHGTVDGIQEEKARIKIAENTIITVEKVGLLPLGEIPKEENKKLEGDSKN